MVEATEYGFYTVDSNYLEYLNRVDSEVYYNPSYRSSTKPFVGIIVCVNKYKYFIPISSAKEKHRNWKNVSNEHFLIYEVISNDINIDADIYKYYSENEKMHILALLDIKKMIPVPEGHYKRIEFKELRDSRYRDLFQKEYAFCLSIKSKLISKVKTLYKKQKDTGIVRRANCNFLVLEKAMKSWINSL